MIKKIISKILNNNNLSFSWKDDNWDLLLSEINDSKFFFSSSYIHYQIKYLESFFEKVEDISLIFHEDNKPIALWPLIFYSNNDELNLTSDGNYVFTPKFIYINSKNNFSKKMINVFVALFEYKSLAKFKLKEDIRLYDSEISNMHSELLKNNFKIKSVYNIVLHLNKSITEIKSGFRKSYKSLINSGLKSFNVQFLNYYDKKLFGKFKSLHKKAAGKVTRSDDSWDFQLDMIKSKNAILSYVLEDDKMIGGALFFLNQGEALYAVGAYDRDLNHLPLGHIIHYKSIEYFLENKIEIYRIGEFLNSNLNPSITKKEESISFFKDGFGGNKYISNIFNLP